MLENKERGSMNSGKLSAEGSGQFCLCASLYLWPWGALPPPEHAQARPSSCYIHLWMQKLGLRLCLEQQRKCWDLSPPLPTAKCCCS